MGAFLVGGLPEPLECIAFRADARDGVPDPAGEALRDLGILSNRLGSPTALYETAELGQVILTIAPVPPAAQGGIRGREYRPVGEVVLDPSSKEDRHTMVRLVHQGLRDYMASRPDFMAVGRNAYANSRPAGEEGRWYIHRRMTFRVDDPGVLMLTVDVGQIAVDRDPITVSPPTSGLEGGEVTAPAILGTPDGVWMARIERIVEEVSVGDPVVMGPGGERETLVEHYRRMGMRATARVVDPGDPVVYLRRFIHGRPGREEPHAASLVHALASPEETPVFDPPPSARWRIVQGMANQLGRARLGAHDLRLDMEAPIRPEEQGTVDVPPEDLRTSRRLEPTVDTVGRWDAERRNALKDAGVEPGAPRLGPTVLAYQEGVAQGAAATMYSDVRYNLFRYLGTKADPRPVRTMEFSRPAELGALLSTVAPTPSAVIVVAHDPAEAYLTAKATLPGAAVQAMSAATLASRPVHGEADGDTTYFNAVLWLATALEREAGRAPWTLDAQLGADAFLGLSLLGRGHEEGGGTPARGLVAAVDARAGGTLSIGGVVDLDGGRFRGERAATALARAIAPMAEARGPPGSIVVHREGSLSRPERKDLTDILRSMVAEGLLADGFILGFVELGLEHPFRLFQEGMKGPATCRAGSWARLDDRTALLATAGYPVKTRGTPEVLMVTARSGADPVVAAIEVQTLGALDWGGREVRWPATIWGPRAEMGTGRARPWG